MCPCHVTPANMAAPVGPEAEVAPRRRRGAAAAAPGVRGSSEGPGLPERVEGLRASARCLQGSYGPTPGPGGLCGVERGLWERRGRCVGL